MTDKQVLSIAALLVAGTFLFSYLLFRVPQKPTDSTFTNEFSLVHQDYSGKDIHLYEYRRQLIIAYAWASWCTYCGGELQDLAKLRKTYGDKIQILAINRAESLPDAKSFTDRLGVSNEVTLLLDPKDTFFKSIGGYAMPEMVFIDKNGNVVFHQRGPLDMAALEAKLKELVH